MNNALMFSSKSDEWSTPQELFEELDAEFNFQIDLAATYENAKCRGFFTQEQDALVQDWSVHDCCWLNPPYSRPLCRKFIAKAHEARLRGSTVVMLLPARTDTVMFHDYIWDESKHAPRIGVEVRFLKGRLKFGGCKDAAPFPSMIVVFRP